LRVKVSLKLNLFFGIFVQTEHLLQVICAKISCKVGFRVTILDLNILLLLSFVVDLNVLYYKLTIL